MAICPYHPLRRPHVCCGERSELGIGRAVEPKQLASDVDAGLIGMEQRGYNELILYPCFKELQTFKGFLVEIENGASTDRHLHLVKKMIFNAVVRDQLILRHVDSVGFDSDSILDRARNPLGEWSYKAPALLILENLRSVLGDYPGYIQVNDLARLEPYIVVPAFG